MNTLNQRLRIAREAIGMSQAELAKAAGVSQGTIGNLESGLRKRPRDIVALASALKVHPEWLDTGDGPMAASDASEAPITPYDPSDPEFTPIQHYSVRFSNGHGVGILTEHTLQTLIFRTDFLKSMGLSANNAVAVNSTGDSNYPTIPKGEGLLLTKRISEGQIQNGKLHAFRLGDDLLVKRLTRLDDGTYIATSDNPEYGPIVINRKRAHEFELIGIVKWFCSEIN